MDSQKEKGAGDVVVGTQGRPVTGMTITDEADMTTPPLLEVSELATWLPTPRGTARVVDGVSLRVEHGTTLGIVGESGSGKSMLARSILHLPPAGALTPAGEVCFLGRDLRRLNAQQLRSVWGAQIGIVLQDPMTSLNPVMRVGHQVMEPLRVKLGLSSAEARRWAMELLDQVRVPDPRRRFAAYPHELSGGMRQRVSIAAAIACGPSLLIADEPTTALDVTVQRDVLDLLTALQRDKHMGMILITHDLAVIAGRSDMLAVMYAGKIVETGPTGSLFTQPRHPYTAALLRATPRLDQPSQPRLPVIPGAPPALIGSSRGCRFAPRCERAQPRCLTEEPALSEADHAGHAFACFHPVGGTVAIAPPGSSKLPAPSATVSVRPAAALPAATRDSVPSSPALAAKDDVILAVEHLNVEYRTSGGKTVHAVSDISFDIRRGEMLGLVGESGCGKSTTARALVVDPPPTAGAVVFEGRDMTRLSRKNLRRTRPRLQFIFQDPVSSLNPRRRVGRIVREGLDIWQRDADRVDELLQAVGLDPDAVRDSRPHELSGGQCQRVAIARALALEPLLLICDEAVSALDISIQAQILNLLKDMRERYGLTLLFIAHDLAVVKSICDRVAVMYLGKLCEIAPSSVLYGTPLHPYTQALLAAAPVPVPGAVPVSGAAGSGELPSPLDQLTGCRFHTRCPLATARCSAEEPAMREVGPDHLVACHAVP